MYYIQQKNSNNQCNFDTVQLSHTWRFKHNYNEDMAIPNKYPFLQPSQVLNKHIYVHYQTISTIHKSATGSDGMLLL